MSTVYKIETWKSGSTVIAMFEDRKTSEDFTMGLGPTDWEAIEDLVKKKASGLAFNKTALPLVGYKLEELEE
jgi:hypothetical protein